MSINIKIRRALISVSDKTGVVELARVLQSLGCEIISTGGTQTVLNQANISTIDISTVTGNPEAFGGRMKTISFQIESALLFDRERDAAEAAQLGILPIDLVVCNLYPFAQVLAKGGNFEELIENIDIGGPTMIRAAAKNFKYVAVVTQPADYSELIAQLQENQGNLTYEFRRQLMAKAFNHTADYDALVATTMDKSNGAQSLRLAYAQGSTLRYGENAHQQAAFYREVGASQSLANMEILGGKELSYNNILDVYGAVNAVKESTLPACAIIKHSNPCGYAEGADVRQIFELAWAGDTVSAFGSVIAFNAPLDKTAVEFLKLDAADKSMRKFVEVIVAPDFTPEAVEYLQLNKNLRIIRYDARQAHVEHDYRFLNGALLVQNADNELVQTLDLATKTAWDVEQDRDLILFGVRAIKNIKSNAIAIVRKHEGCFQLVGMGAGQPNRLNSTKLALEKTLENLNASRHNAELHDQLADCVLVSDAFFPFEDNVEFAYDYGIRKIVQPSGSIRDKFIVDKCDELGVAMTFTNMRHFKH